MDTSTLRRIPAVAESELSKPVADRLPDHAPPAPWRCRLEAVVWAHRSAPDARSALPEPLRFRGRPRLTVGGLLRYTDSPVGAYTELFGGLVLPQGLLTVHVPFMAVDSLPSLYGGRVNWALPKTLAGFSGAPGRGTATCVETERWRVGVRLRASGPSLPAAAGLSVVQAWPDGEAMPFRAVLAGRTRPAMVDVDVESDGSLAGWLRPGRHAAVHWPAARLHVRGPRGDAGRTARH